METTWAWLCQYTDEQRWCGSLGWAWESRGCATRVAKLREILNFLKKGQTCICPGSSSISTYRQTCRVFHLQSSVSATSTWKCVPSLMSSNPLTQALISCEWQHSCSHRWDTAGPQPSRTQALELGFMGERGFCISNSLPLLESTPGYQKMLCERVSRSSREVKVFHLFETTHTNPKYIQIEKCQNRVTKTSSSF